MTVNADENRLLKTLNVTEKSIEYVSFSVLGPLIVDDR